MPTVHFRKQTQRGLAEGFVNTDMNLDKTSIDVAVNQTFSVTATLTRTDTGAGVEGLAIKLKWGSTTLESIVTNNAGKATFTLQMLQLGTHYLDFIYAGGDCAGGCTASCTEGCVVVCVEGCTESCVTCTNPCIVSCTQSCTNPCIAGCTSGCTAGCISGCVSGCVASCISGCVVTCTSGCTESCTVGCTNTCTAPCTRSCIASCTTSCIVTCTGGTT